MKRVIDKNRTDYGVSTQANTADVLTEIFRLTVPKKMVYDVYDETFLALKLYTSVPAEIGADSKLVIGVLLPGEEDMIPVGKLDYNIYANLTYAEQFNVNNQEFLRLSLERAKVTIKEDEALIIKLKSSSVVDWSQANTQIRFEIEASRI